MALTETQKDQAKMIETNITWNKTEDVTPPFDEAILVLVGGEEYSNGVWRRYLKPMEVVMRKNGPLDDSEGESDYERLVSGKEKFENCLFYLNELNPDGDEDGGSDWGSDTIVLWAKSPISELFDLVTGTSETSGGE